MSIKTMKSTSVSPLPQEAYSKNANIYKILANPKRLEVLNILKGGEAGVEDLLRITGLTKANLSQHLALLRHNGLVRTRREGLNVFYTIVDARIVEPCKILHQLRSKQLVI
jgi:DNA-binding transcriptional ArsR family regulator